MRTWTDENTGRQVRQLTDLPDGAEVGYLRYPRLLPDGRMIGRVLGSGCLAAIDPESGDLEQFQQPGAFILLRPWDGYAVFPREREIWGVTLPHGEPTLLGRVPEDIPGHVRKATFDLGAILLVESNDSTEGCPNPGVREHPEWFWQFMSRPRSSVIRACQLETGRVTELVRTEGVGTTHWDPSPTDHSLLKFAHDSFEGAGQRIWTVRLDGSGLCRMRPQQRGETVLGEFWMPDGRHIGYKFQDRRSDLTFETLPWAEYAQADTRVGVAAPDGREVYLSDPICCYQGQLLVSPDGRWLCGDGTEGHSFLFGGPFSMDSTRVELTPLATIHTPYVPMAGQNVQAAFTADSRLLVYNDTIAGRRQVCVVEVGG